MQSGISLKKLAQDILKSHGLSPKKHFSQNFLIDQDVYSDIVRAADITLADQIIEIGPGLGFLTTELIERAGRVVAVEIDEILAGLLRGTEILSSNLTVINNDILRVDLESLPTLDISKGYKVVANIPYHITAKILRFFLTQEHKPTQLVLLVQREVAERITASAGQHSLLSVSVQVYGTPQIVRIVPKSAFYPAPKVDSAIMSITLDQSYVQEVDEKLFWQVLKSAFMAKRKKLVTTLSKHFDIDKSILIAYLDSQGLPEGSRPQHLHVEDWVALTQFLETQNQA